MPLDGRSLARANALATALGLARGLAHELGAGEVPAGALGRVNALILALARADALNTDRVLDLDRVLGLGRGLVLALTAAVNADHADALERARGIAVALEGELADVDPVACWTREVVADGAWSMPGQTSRGLVALAVWLLPAAQRSRYRAEFGADLVELPCQERLRYSVRVLLGTWEMRWVLGAVRTRDSVAARRARR
ncbi:MAG TPA: hypothetical protein VFO16_08935 [Pseudonocardiaceae bacterium]|nr:hypothetical protein [Pseudonocardiaceae bacterium]